MRREQTFLIIISLILLSGVFLGACQRAQSTITPAGSITTSPLELTPSSTAIASVEVAYPPPPGHIASPTSGPRASATLEPPVTSPSPVPSLAASKTQAETSPTPTSTNTVIPQYPGPGFFTSTPRYPGPVVTRTPLPYPGPVTPTHRPTRTPSRSVTPTVTHPGTIAPSPTTGFVPSTPSQGTPVATPTERPPRPPISPPPAGSSVTIWHSWGSAETEMLKSIIQSFQRNYPDVTFSLLYVPLDDLLSNYREDSYLGQGPSLLFGPASWGPELFEGELITDLYPFVPPDYLTKINSAALASGEYSDSLISLPLSQHGTVMFRNMSLIDRAPATFEELDSLSHEITRAGIVGSYLERGSYFSAANIDGLGGRLMDKHGYPTFNDAFGLEWLSLLADYDKAGAITFNTNRDLDMFKRSRVGIIIDGTWNIATLQAAIGADNLAIDPWPIYGTGHLSGWVESDSVFLNANTSGDNQSAALAFIGYLLDPNVQMRLAEVGHIPSVSDTQPRDRLVWQAMKAFSNGVPYPITVDSDILQLYWIELDTVVRKVFIDGAKPADALTQASQNLAIVLMNRPTSP